MDNGFYSPLSSFQITLNSPQGRPVGGIHDKTQIELFQKYLSKGIRNDEDI